MLNFRKKVFYSDLILLLIFLSLLFPLVKKTAEKIIWRSLNHRTQEIINEISNIDSEKKVVKYLTTRQWWHFFRTCLINQDKMVIFESHHPKFFPYSAATNPDIEQAFSQGVVYSDSYSNFFSQTFIYVSMPFMFQGEKYVLRTGFPFREIEALTHTFEVGFLTFAAIVLLLYGVMTWAVIHRLSYPIQQVIDEIKKYQEGKLDYLPRIELPDDDDDLSHLALTLNTLSDQIQTQIQALVQERNENQGILESLNEGIVALDVDNQITYVNDMACKILKLPKDLLIDVNINKISSVIMDFCKHLITKIYRNGTIVSDSLTLGKLHYDVVGIPKSQKQGIILVFQDRTSENVALKMGKDFIANASHELRTPITIIRGFAETLQDIPDLSKEKLVEITEKIVRTCERLTKLVSNLLVLADLDNQFEIQAKKTPINTLVENCKHMLLMLHPKVRLETVFLKEETYANANADLLELAIMNLLENAVKYSNVPAKIRIHVAEENDEVSIHIYDSGIGISKAQLEHIFERFFTVDKNRSRRSGGAGLGLSIVKNIIEKHKGFLEVESQERVGSIFKIRLPALLLSKI